MCNSRRYLTIVHVVWNKECFDCRTPLWTHSLALPPVTLKKIENMQVVYGELSPK